MPSRRPPDRSRRAAFDALRRVNGEGAYANLVLPELLTERRISGRDAAFATELLAGTCRGQGSYDLIIAAAADRALSSLQPAVLDLLRLGSHQILAMRVPAHAAVAATVDLTAATVGQRVTGLVNAVLRRVAAHDLDTWLTRLADGLDPRDRLAVLTAHPRWIVDAYADLLPPEEVEHALRANNSDVGVTLAVRPGLAEVSELLDAGAEPARHSKFAARWAGNPADLPAVREGRAGVQDEGSQLVTAALAAVPAARGRWLDLCAGPGGKTALLAGLADRSDSVVAVDVAHHRAALVRRAVRAYPEPPVVLVADGTRAAWRAGSFAKVLADVPCTGLGALRRRPEARWRRRPDEVEQLHGLQLALLASAIDSASRGGVIGYVTCSPHRRETVDVVFEILATRDDVEVIPAAGLLPGSLDAALIAAEPRGGSSGSPPSGTAPVAGADFVQLWPHRHGTDAMFAAYLRHL
jgi:16S rRNA (cytosine967-C5)-methyltransferase